MTKTGTGVAGRANPDISVAGRNPVMFDVMHQKPLSWLVTGLSVRLALPVVCVYQQSAYTHRRGSKLWSGHG